MTIEYKWSVLNTDRKVPSGYIFCVHWQCTGADGDITSSVYATCSFEDGTPVIPYDDVTEAEVLNWIWATGVDKAATEASIAARIEDLKNPKEAFGVPWS